MLPTAELHVCFHPPTANSVYFAHARLLLPLIASFRGGGRRCDIQKEAAHCLPWKHRSLVTGESKVCMVWSPGKTNHPPHRHCLHGLGSEKPHFHLCHSDFHGTDGAVQGFLAICKVSKQCSAYKAYSTNWYFVGIWRRCALKAENHQVPFAPLSSKK